MSNNSSTPLIAVARDKFYPGQDAWLWHRLPGELPPYEIVDLVTALATEYGTDAHFVPYVAFQDGEPVRHQPRLIKEKLPEVRQHGFEVRLSVLVADVDSPGHQPITPEQIEDARSRLNAIQSIGWYTSKAGLRIFQPLTAWLPPEQYEAALVSWWPRLQAVLGENWIVDAACSDWTRHYRLPHVIRDGKPTKSAIDIGKMTAITAEVSEQPPKVQPAPPERPLRSVMTPGVAERAGRYVGRIPVPACGSGRCQAALWNVCLHLVKGFSLDEDTAYSLAADWASTSSHDWQEKDIRHKVADAARSNVPEGFHLDAPSVDIPLDGAPGLAVDEHEQPAPDAAFGTSPGSTRRRFQLTDLGNAERLVSQHGKDIRYCPTWDKWLIWDGRRWAVDRLKTIEYMAQMTVRSIYTEARDEEDADRRKALAEHAKRSEGNARKVAMIEQAKSIPGVPILPEDLDKDPWVLNVQNGTVDLRTGALREHRREDLITKLAGAAYDPTAECPLWDRFLERVLPDAEVRQLMMRLDGYALSGVVEQHVLPIKYGTGRNGKGVHDVTLLTILGDYARQVPTELLMMKRGESHPTERTTLFGTRLAIAVETEENRSLNVAFVKQATGGDRISARRMREDFWEFSPTHKIQLSTNHRPVIRETKDAIWERVVLIPWTVKIPKHERDVKLIEKLKAEASGILYQLVQACLSWQKDGLPIPEAVQVATDQYRTDMDVLGSFLDACCVIEPSATATAQDLFSAFEAWAEENNEKDISQTAFGSQLAERGFEKKRDSRTGRIVWAGVRVRTPGGSDGVPQPQGIAVEDLSAEELDAAAVPHPERSEQSEPIFRITAHEGEFYGLTGNAVQTIQTIQPSSPGEGSATYTTAAEGEVTSTTPLAVQSPPANTVTSTRPEVWIEPFSPGWDQLTEDQQRTILLSLV